jgi:hypothetical protein
MTQENLLERLLRDPRGKVFYLRDKESKIFWTDESFWLSSASFIGRLHLNRDDVIEILNKSTFEVVSEPEG